MKAHRPNVRHGLKATGRPAAPVNVATGAARLFSVIFIVANILLSVYFLDSVPSPNPTSRVLPVLTLYEEGTYAIDKYEKLTIDKAFINGHYYSDKAPLSTLVVLPFYGLLRALDLTGTDAFHWLPVALLGDVLCGSLPFVVLLWLVLRKLVGVAPATNPVLLCLFPLYGSCVFAYSGVFMGHLLAGILLCGSYILLKRRRYPTACGLLLGLAVLAELPAALAVPIWAVAIARTRRRDLFWFLAGGLPCVLALLLSNYAITGSLVTMPYAYVATTAFAGMRTAYGVSLPKPDALWGLLFSTYRGLFFYAPGLIVIAIAYVAARGTKVFREDLLSPLGLLAVCYVLLISSYFVWWGGWAYRSAALDSAGHALALRRDSAAREKDGAAQLALRAVGGGRRHGVGVKSDRLDPDAGTVLESGVRFGAPEVCARPAQTGCHSDAAVSSRSGNRRVAVVGPVCCDRRWIALLLHQGLSRTTPWPSVDRPSSSSRCANWRERCWLARDEQEFVSATLAILSDASLRKRILCLSASVVWF